MHAVVRAAFEARPPLDPPADALAETAGVSSAAAGCGTAACSPASRARPVGALVLDPVGQHDVAAPLRRASRPRSATASPRALVDAAVEAADGYDDVTVVAREELPATIEFWERHGFREIRRESPNVELRRPLRKHHVTERVHTKKKKKKKKKNPPPPTHTHTHTHKKNVDELLKEHKRVYLSACKNLVLQGLVLSGC